MTGGKHNINDDLLGKMGIQPSRQQPAVLQPMLMSDPNAGIAALVDAGVLTPEEGFNLLFKQMTPTQFNPQLRQIHNLQAAHHTMTLIDQTNDQQKSMSEKGYVMKASDAPPVEVTIPDSDDVIAPDELAPNVVINREEDMSPDMPDEPGLGRLKAVQS